MSTEETAENIAPVQSNITNKQTNKYKMSTEETTENIAPIQNKITNKQTKRAY